MGSLIAAAALAACSAFAASIPASAVQLRAGDLLVTDAVNARVLHVAPDTGEVTPFSPRATSGPNLLFAPAGIAIDPDGAIFVADSFADRIVRIDPTTGAQAVVRDFSAQIGDFGPSDVGTAPQGIDLEDTVSGLDRRDLFVASADGLYRVSRSADATSTAPLSSAADVLLGTDLAVQENLGEPYSLWVVANGVLVRWYFENGATQALTESDARNVSGVEYALGTPLFTRTICYSANSLNGLFVYDGAFGGTQLEGDGFASCLGRPLAVASPTLLYGTYGDADVVALVPEIGGYASAIVATLPEGDVPPVAADLAVAPVTFPAPEPGLAAMAAAAALALALAGRGRARRAGRRRPLVRALTTCAAMAAVAAPAGAGLRPGDVLVVDLENERVLRVTQSGGVTTFSPPPATTNLFDSPSGIGVGPDGTIVVANESGSLVQLDPASGAQALVAGVFSGPPDLGVEPQDVAVNPRVPAPGFEPSLYVGAKDELRLVTRSAFSTDGTQLAPFPPAWLGWETHHVSLWAPNDTDPFDVFASIVAAVLRYDGDQDAILDYWVAPSGWIEGLDVAPGATPTVGVAWRKSPCPSSENGIYLVNPVGQPIESAWSTGGLLECPRGLAWFGSFDAYTLADGDPPRLIELDATSFYPPVVAQRIAATMPSGTKAVDLAVYAPEPAGALGGSVAVLAVAFVARRIARLAASDTIG